MLNAPLPRVGCGDGSNDARHVTGECYAALPRTPSDREVRLSRELAMHLHEIRAEPNERIDGGPSFVRRAREKVRDGNVAAFEVRSGRDDARPDETSTRDVLAVRRERGPVASHVSDARDAV